MSTADIHDRQALADLLATYAASVDERDMVRYASCFTDDIEVIGFGQQTMNGRDTWVTYVSQALEKFTATQHLLGMQLADIDGDIARTRTDVQATHFTEAEAPAILWATYLSRMRRIDGHWKIYRHELVVRGTG